MTMGSPHAESAPPAGQRARSSARIDWVDGARGTAMVLLLVWHAASIPDVMDPAVARMAMPHPVEVANDALQLVRMPLLMFLSGLVAHRTMQRPLGEYYWRKVATLVWPYALWGLLDLQTYEHQSATDPWSWDGAGYLWFLWFVIVFSMVAPLLRAIPPPVIAIVALAGAATLHARFPDDAMLGFAVYFFAGLSAARYPALFDRALRTTPLLVLCGVLGCVGAVASARHVSVNPALLVPLGLATVLALAGALSRVQHFPEPVLKIGRRSIVWYLVHFPVMHLVVWSLHRSGLDLPWAVYAGAALATAVVVCRVVSPLSTQRPLSYLFALPTSRSRADQSR